jgi:predicted MFS family arabinose efflux permease
MNAVSLNTMGMNTFRILAPAATGFLIDAYDFASVYYISGVMYGMASVCMFLMPKTAQKFSEGSNALADIIDGVKYIRREKTMLLVLVATLCVMICGIPFLQLMPMITEDVLMVGASGMGILLSVSGLGAITGSIILASIPSRKRGAIMLASGIIMGLALVVFAFSELWLVSVLVVIFIGTSYQRQLPGTELLSAGIPRPDNELHDDGNWFFQSGHVLRRRACRIYRYTVVYRRSGGNTRYCVRGAACFYRSIAPAGINRT